MKRLLLLLLLIPFVHASFETGTAELSSGWNTVSTLQTYTNPVVVAYTRDGAENGMDVEVSTVILTNVTSTSFRAQIRTESTSLAGNISYVVAEQGVQELDSGILLQAGTIAVDNYDAAGENAASWKQITFPQAYAQAPVVLASTQESTAQDWLAVRYQTATRSTTGISMSVERDEASGSAPIATSDTLGWISINQTSTQAMEANIASNIAQDAGSGDWVTVLLANSYTEPLFFGYSGDAGSDPTKVGHQNLQSNSVDIRHTEERSADAEQNHATVDIMYAVLESGLGNAPPTIPTQILCDEGVCDMNRFYENISLQASGSVDAENDSITYTIQAAFQAAENSSDQEVADPQNPPLGETGSVTLSGTNSILVPFSLSYSSTPIVVVTPATDDGSDNAIIGVVRAVNTTHVNISICQDQGNAFCDGVASPQELHWYAFNQDIVDDYDWIQAGTVTGITDGSDTAVTFLDSFSNVPYVFGSVQGFSGSGIAPHLWAHSSSVSGATLIGCEHPGTADACGSGSSETFGWVAINPVTMALLEGQIGTESIANSDWTPVSFSPNVTSPRMMVLQNDDAGAQDGQYPMARSVSSSGADIRYCEQDGPGTCDGHAAETVRWFVHPDGDLAVEQPENDGIQEFTAIGGIPPVGETGSVSLSGTSSIEVVFEETYATTPIVVVTPASDNDGSENAIIGVVEQVNTTHVTISICQDRGNTVCDPVPTTEDLHYYVFNNEAVDTYDWIDSGTVTGTTNGGNTPISFSQTFSSVPYVFGSVQGFSGSGIAPHLWAHSVSSSGASLIGCEHPGTADACGSGTSESFGWVAIDPVAMELVDGQIGTQPVSASTYTAVSFSPVISSARLMVLQNSDNGGQDPQYPQARSVTSSGADIRYCEQDGPGVCDGHVAEDVMWFAHPDGTLRAPGVVDEVDATRPWIQYNNTLLQDWQRLTSLDIIVNISSYNDSGSVANGNSAPALQIQAYNGSSWINISSVSGLGSYSLDASVVSQAWRLSENSDIRIRAENLDYASSTEIDTIAWDVVVVQAQGRQWNTLGSHNQSSSVVWNSLLYAPDNCMLFRASARDVFGTNTSSDWLTTNCVLLRDKPQEYCWYEFVEQGDNYQEGYISQGDIVVYNCPFESPVRAREEFSVDVLLQENMLSKQLTLPTTVYGERLVVFS